MANASEPLQEAIVVTSYGRRFELRLADRTTVNARTLGRRLRPVCGDTAMATPIEAERDWLISDIVPRRNELTRPDLRGRTEVLAANVSMLAVIVAALPPPDWFIVDRYLVAAIQMSASALIVAHKRDLELPPADEKELAALAAAGYAVVRSSCRPTQGVDALADAIGGHTALCVGQSGVGKSSLINALVGGEEKTAAVSEKTGEGRHTTVTARMLAVNNKTDIIDSPGVRDYAPSIEDVTRVERGYVEIVAAATGCRFKDCRHLREPGCAVKDKVENGRINGRRYESYRRLLRLTESLQEKRR